MLAPMPKTLKAFIASESGATAIEYGLLAAILSVVIVGAGGSIKTALNLTFSNTSSGVGSVN
jgi:pilus assembly protein Flp/PilA